MVVPQAFHQQERYEQRLPRKRVSVPPPGLAAEGGRVVFHDLQFTSWCLSQLCSLTRWQTMGAQLPGALAPA